MIFNKSAYDYMIVGLGNPGITYEKTRHNAGFMAIDKIAEINGGSFNKHKFESVYGECNIDSKRILILKPETFMNLSGKAVVAAAAFYKIPVSKIIVIFDDITLGVGKIRVRRRGTHGGHNGIKDIIELMGSDEIMRVKVGVGERPDRQSDLKDWVLGKIPDEQMNDFEAALKKAALAVEEIIKRGVDSAMNKYNG